MLSPPLSSYSSLQSSNRHTSMWLLKEGSRGYVCEGIVFRKGSVRNHHCPCQVGMSTKCRSVVYLWMAISSSAPKIQSMTLLKLSRNPKLDWQEWAPCLLVLSNRIAVGFLKEATSGNNTVVSDSPGLEVLHGISELSLLSWMNIIHRYPSHLGTRAPLRICRRNGAASPPWKIHKNKNFHKTYS